ncbi:MULTISPECIES: hypothetical protein [Morganellaceae]|uniref:hypothetical protein n=1 Tax=Morganellaceae TaxID=1903414 RepID=UPI000F63997E|nr:MULTISPECIES: hypothetical protein [Morganellaceae]EKX9076396.1 hypothetical protein [Proteus mirabilis]MCW4542224.1 hypothetical protein [Providencia rettgeri]RRN87687.1 hypothetical protein D2048_23720 [Morganella morganii]MBG5884860.1 hypothetical protein [Providencia alcalifaciens]UDN38480.1 hypothetical protein LG402_22175 [Proteus sp. NMG38-2]
MTEKHLVGFFKKNKDEKIYKITSSNEAFFENFVIVDEVQKFDPDDRSDLGNVYYIDLLNDEITNVIFSDLKSLSSNDTINTSNYTSLKSNESKDVFKNMRYVASKDGKYLFFQSINKNKIIGGKILSLKNMQVLDGGYVSISDEPDVIFDLELKRFLFKSIAKARRIFSGFDAYYKEAGVKDVKAFIKRDEIIICPDFNEEKVNSLNKKRIQAEIDKQSSLKKSLGDNYNNYIENDLKECISDLAMYYPDLVSEDKVVINNNSDLTNYLYALDERLYTTKRSKAKRMVTAMRKL